MRKSYTHTLFSESSETMDALLALQMLEEQEQQQEQEFFRLIGEIQQFGLSEQEVEKNLPGLLQTRRECALYEALMTLVRTAHHPARLRLHTQERGGFERELREWC